MAYRKRKAASLTSIDKSINKYYERITFLEAEQVRYRLELLKLSVSENQVNLFYTTLSRLNDTQNSESQKQKAKWHSLRYFVGLEKHHKPKNVLEDFYHTELYIRCNKHLDMERSIRSCKNEINEIGFELLQLEKDAAHCVRRRTH